MPQLQITGVHQTAEFLGLLPMNQLRFATIATGFEWIATDIFMAA